MQDCSQVVGPCTPHSTHQSQGAPKIERHILLWRHAWSTITSVQGRHPVTMATVSLLDFDEQ